VFESLLRTILLRRGCIDHQRLHGSVCLHLDGQKKFDQRCVAFSYRSLAWIIHTGGEERRDESQHVGALPRLSLGLYTFAVIHTILGCWVSCLVGEDAEILVQEILVEAKLHHVEAVLDQQGIDQRNLFVRPSSHGEIDRTFRLREAAGPSKQLEGVLYPYRLST